MLWLILLPAFLATFLALALLEVAFYLIIIANLLLHFADLLTHAVRHPAFALVAGVLSLLYLSFPSNVAVAMLLADEVDVVATAEFARDLRLTIRIVPLLAGAGAAMGTILIASFLVQLWRDW